MPVRFVPLERVSARSLTFGEFLERFWIPDRPFILVDAAGEMTATARWSLQYLLRVADPAGRCQAWVHRGRAREEGTAKVGEMLALLRRRREAGLGLDRLYMTNWAFGIQNPRLLRDIEPPRYFRHDLSPIIRGGPGYYKWIYIGEEGTSTRTHVDVANTSAWLLLFEGTKEWRIVRSADAVELLGGQARPSGVDLFELGAGRARGGRLDVYEGTQRAGEIVWNPSRCVHAVRNRSFSMAVTYNYVDLTNLASWHDSVRASPALKKQLSAPLGELGPRLVRTARRRLARLADRAAVELLMSRVREPLAARGLASR